MPRTWTQNFYHAIFSTKNRVKSITPELEERLYPFLGGIVRDLRCTSYAINGMPDHVHLLIRYRPDLSHSDMLRHIKSRSSGWVHETFPEFRSFDWQEGYGGFTVSKSAVDDVVEYIRNQKQHHSRFTYEKELMELFRRHGMEVPPEEAFG